MKKNKKNIKKIILFAIPIIILLTIGFTYSFWIWESNSSQRTAVNITVTPNFSCSVDGGGNITSNSNKLAPASCTNSQYAIKKEITATANINTGDSVYMDLWLNVNSIGSRLSADSSFKYAITTSEDSCDVGVISSGSFRGKEAEDSINLISGTEFEATSNKTYYLWIWIDSSAEYDSTTQGQTFNLSLGGECTQNEVLPDIFEVEDITNTYQYISATAVSGTNNITHYAITTSNSCDSVTWNSVAEPTRTYVLDNYEVSAVGDYYACFKDSEDNTVISSKVTVESIKTVKPSCTWGTFTNASISDGETSNITLTCTDDIGISDNLEISDLTLSGSKYAKVAAVNKTNTGNTYTYNITVIGDSNNATSGSTTITIPENAIENDIGYGNTAVTSTSSLTVTNGSTVKAIFYYNSNTTAGSQTISTTTVTTACTKGTSCTVTVPSVVTSSVGKYNLSYAGVATSMNSITPGNLTISENTIYYAFYTGGSVTNYYYDSGYKTRTLYKNEIFSGIDSLTAILNTTSNSATNIDLSSETGYNNSTLAGYSAGQDATIEYNSLSEAANSTSNTIYSVYQYKVNYEKGTNVSAIGATSGSCNITMGISSCVVTTPSITPTDETFATGWNTASGLVDGTSPNSSLVITENNKTYYANAYENISRTPKVLLLANNVAEYIYDGNTYTAGSTYGSTTITNAYLGNNTTVPIITNATQKNYVKTVNFNDSFKSYRPNDASYMFNGYRYMSNMINPDNFDTSNVTNMQNMFRNAGYNATTFNLNLSNWNTSNVTNMAFIFGDAGWNTTIFNLNLNNWNTSNVTNMVSMFDSAGGNATTWNIGDLNNWDTSKVTNMAYMFAVVGSKTTTLYLNLSNWNTSNVTNMSYMFYNAGENSTTLYLNLSNWNTSNINNMSNMFRNTGKNATTWNVEGLNNWNTSKVTNMSGMFNYAGYKATTFDLDLGNWDVSNVTNMSFMFETAGVIATTWNIGNLNNWNTSKVTNMAYMFEHAGGNATTLSIGNLSDWNTSNVTSMSFMFYDAGFKATTLDLDLSNWNTSNVTNMSNMFSAAGYNATTWNIGNLNNWDTSKVTNMAYMFSAVGDNSTIFNLDLSNWNTSKVTNMAYMFGSAVSNATTLDLDLSSWDISNVTNMLGMFHIVGINATNLNLNLNNWNISNVTNMSNMFENTGYALMTFNLNLSNWNVSKSDMSSMFENLGNNTTNFSLDLSNWNTSKVTNIESMFRNTGRYASTLNIVGLDNWNTSNITNMYMAFYGTGESATTWSIGNLSNWNTSKVTSMYSMFKNAGMSSTTWNIGNLSNWNTSNVVSMGSLFANVGKNASTFNLYLNNWNTSSVTNMSQMFNGATKLNKIYVGEEWNTSSVTSSTSMFYNCTSLVGGNGTTYNSSYINAVYARIDGDGGAGYLTFGGNSTYTVTVSSNNTSYGTVSGGGTKTSAIDTTVTATPASGYELLGWYENDELVSTDYSYTFKVFRDRTLEARFSQKVTISVTSSNTTYGTVSGGGSYPVGREITIVATKNSGYAFNGWYNGDTLISKEKSYTFTASTDITLTAQFAQKGYSVELVSGGASYGFEQITSTTSDTTPVTNPTSYNMYGSLNKGVDSSSAVMKVTINGYSTFTLYINSYAQTYYDYTIVTTLDATTIPTSYKGTTAKGYTWNYQKNPNTFSTSNYKTVTFSNIDTEEHYFYIVYKKDSSGAAYNDRGYVLINPNQ